MTEAMATAKDVSEALEYARRLYDDVLAWYLSADTKAQVLLGLDGAFMAFLAATTFQKSDDLGKLIDSFPTLTWVLLVSMGVTLLMSMVAAVYCLWSRIHFASSLEEWITNAETPARTETEYPPEVMWFFQHLAALEPQRFRETLASVDAPFELHAMASQIEKLSGNVRKKHIAVDLGFVLAMLTLLLFAAAAVSYVGHHLSAG